MSGPPAGESVPAPAGRGAEPLWTESRYRMALGAGGGLLFLLLFLSMGIDLDVPARPAKPKKATIASGAKFSAQLDRNPGTWSNYLVTDSRTYGIAVVSPDELSVALAYRVDTAEHTLEPGEGGQSEVEVAGLRLRLVVRDVDGSRKRNLVLQIENTTADPMAYRVETQPSRGTRSCAGKEDLTHNAMAIGPYRMESRSECVYRKGSGLKVTRVETISLPELSYYYVSRLFPPQVGIEKRVSGGHQPAKGEVCRLILPAEVNVGLRDGTVQWRDMIDFYARHRCETYSYPSGYRAFERDNERPLPAVGAR